MDYYSGINKNEILSFVTTWMDLEHIMLRKISQSDKYSVMSLAYINQKLKSMNQTINRNAVIDTENKEMVTREDRVVVMRELGETDWLTNFPYKLNELGGQDVHRKNIDDESSPLGRWNKRAGEV